MNVFTGETKTLSGSSRSMAVELSGGCIGVVVSSVFVFSVFSVNFLMPRCGVVWQTMLHA